MIDVSRIDPVSGVQGPLLPEDTSLLLAGGAYAVGYLVASLVLGPRHQPTHNVWRRRAGSIAGLAYILTWATFAGVGFDVNVLPSVHSLFDVCNVFGIGPFAASVTAFLLRMVAGRDELFEDDIAARAELWYGLSFACAYVGHWVTS